MIALTLFAALALAAPEAAAAEAGVPEAAASEAPTPQAATPHPPATLAPRTTDLVGRSPISLRVQGGWVLPADLSRGDCPGEVKDDFPVVPTVNVAVGYRLHRNLAAEFGTGISWANDVAVAAAMPYPITCATVRLARVPLTLGIRAGLSDPEGRAWLGFTAGAGVYFAWLHEEFHPDDSDRITLGRDEERAIGFGGYSGVAFEFRTGPATRLGLELRFVGTTLSFDHVGFSGDGLQLLLGLTHQFGAPRLPPGERARQAPVVARPVDPRRWRVHARLGGFIPMSGDLGRMESGLEGEIGAARILAPGFAVEAAVGYFGASTSVEGASLPEVNVYPLTVGMRGIAPLGERLEASVSGGLGLHLVDYQATPNLEEKSVAPGAYLGAGLAAKVWRSAYLGLDARLIVARATLGKAFEYYNPELDLAGLRIGATVTVPF